MRFVAVLAAIVAVLAQSLPAHAQPGGRDQPRRFQRMPPERPPQNQPPRRDRQDAGETGDRPGRLTPEERRQLRRDIREHGREVYRDGPRRY